MTDLTDQATRDMLEWARIAVASKGTQEHEPWVTAARYILATVPAPAPTLAERLEYRADMLDNGDPDGDTPQALRDLATRATQMEHDLTEATAEVERLTAERDRLVTETGIAREAYDVQTEALKKAHQEHADALALARSNTAEQDTEALHNHDWLAGMKDATRYAVNATLTPADVQPGEAWLVEVNREKRTAVKDSEAGVPWNTVNTSGVFHAEYNEDVTLIARLVPAPRTITDPDDLDRAKRDTIIRDARGVVCSRDSMGHAWSTFTNLADQRPHIVLPATVLWEPVA